ncbi:MAG TPA: FAD-dependent oxidoreductase [Mycobacteriales bacterium]|jgi:2,4-dienoyl-CoA reductase-like NADH-dependent reductase (Old Yellow Enzyme family)/thioredoxin reductase
MSEPQPFPHLFSPIRVGTMDLRNRVMMPPHGSAIGNLWGSDADAERNIAYWKARADAGVAWIDGVSGHIDGKAIPGFEATGVGGFLDGYYRLPFFVERVQHFADTMHAAGATASAQLTMQGGVPFAPSATLSTPMWNVVPHVLTRDEIRWFVEEYAWSAGRAQQARLDGLELHFNHDDMVEWFLSPLTNRRTDEYGGSFENRVRFGTEILRAVRDTVGSTMTVGIRLTMVEEMPGGYGLDGARELAQYWESTGMVDFLHLVMGSPWGNPSYIQPHFYSPAQWSELAGAIRAAVSLPVVHTGRVNSPEAAERVLAAGHADVVGMARAHIAEPELLVKARAGRTSDIRPCVGGNECISRRYVEGLPFGCAVNPHAAKEIDGPWPVAASPRSVLVVGGGPAGMELAALARRSGHEVELWEAGAALGGQLRIAAAAPTYDQYGRYLDWQARRLADLGVKVVLGRRATVDSVLAAGAEVVAVATGAVPRRVEIAGADGAHVHEIRDVLTGAATVGRRVLVVAQDDHMPPLGVADHLASRGHEVTVVYQTPGPAPLLGRYIVGGILGRLSEQGVQLRFMEQVAGIRAGSVTTRNVYSGREHEIDGIDSVVLACGSQSDSALYEQLRGRHPDTRVLGDAYAPRRLVFATRQAYALARELAG